MSLHTLAQHLQTAGRGEDKVLVHMTPREVGGLQSLAMAHGGSLTINPETGLPEAGFLSSILPIVAGLALGPAGAGITFGGLSSAASAGLLVGGASALASGSLQKGLMAGLGAYGGAGMGAGLMGAAPAAAGLGSAQTIAAQNAAAAAAAQNSAIGQSFANMGAAAPVAATLPVNPTMAAGAGSPFGMPAPVVPGQVPAVTTNVPPVAPNQIATSAVQQGTQQGIPSVLNQTTQNLQTAASGLKEILSNPQKAKDYLGENKYNLLMSALSASNMQQQQPPKERMGDVKNFEYQMNYAPSALPPGSTAERTWFGADGGMAVEDMSRQNALMDNQKYPMAYQTTPTYALPSERPISQNVLYPATDAGVTPYSGLASLAKGGSARVDENGVERYFIGGFTRYGSSYSPNPSTAPSVVQNAMRVTPSTLNKTTTPTVTTSTPAKGSSLATLFNPNASVGSPDFVGPVPPPAPLTGTGTTTSTPATGSKPATVFNPYVTSGSLMLSGPTTSSPGVTTTGTRTGTTGTTAGTTSGTRTGTTGTTAGATAGAQAQLPSSITKLIPKGGFKDLNTGITGNSIKDLNTNWNKEITTQQTEFNKFKNNKAVTQILDGTYKWPKGTTEDQKNSVISQVQQIIAEQEADVIEAKDLLTFAIDEFGALHSRTLDGISPFASRTTPEKVKDPLTGQLVDSGKTIYKPYTDKDKLSITKGWGDKPKIVSADDVVKIWETVVGRTPTESEIDMYEGKKMSLDSVAAAANKNPDVSFGRSFTEDQLQSEAKFYLNRELSPSEIVFYSKFNTFGKLRDALTAGEDFINNLNQKNQAQFAKDTAPPTVEASLVQIGQAFNDILGRTPLSASELNQFAGKSMSDIEKILRTSNEYIYKNVLRDPNAGLYVGDLRAYTATTQPDVVVDPSQTGNVATGIITTTTTPGNLTTIGSNIGIVPALQTSNASFDQQIADFTKRYKEYSPTLGNVAYTNLTGQVTSSNVGVPSLETIYSTASNASPIYQPIYKPIPKYSLEKAGAMAYRPVAQELGLENLYTQLGQNMPDLATGLAFSPSDAVRLKGRGGAGVTGRNAATGLSSLQQFMPLPEEMILPSPILPGTQTQVRALTPEEQILLSSGQRMQQNVSGLAYGGMAMGGRSSGMYDLGDYSDGGRLLKGPGDGVSDSIPASIGGGRPARLADGEFVIPARIVSELGNGSTDAGARQLYAMMDRIQRQRRKSVGKNRVAIDSKASKMLPA